MTKPIDPEMSNPVGFVPEDDLPAQPVQPTPAPVQQPLQMDPAQPAPVQTAPVQQEQPQPQVITAPEQVPTAAYTVSPNPVGVAPNPDIQKIVNIVLGILCFGFFCLAVWVYVVNAMEKKMDALNDTVNELKHEIKSVKGASVSMGIFPLHNNSDDDVRIVPKDDKPAGGSSSGTSSGTSGSGSSGAGTPGAIKDPNTGYDMAVPFTPSKP